MEQSELEQLVYQVVKDILAEKNNRKTPLTKEKLTVIESKEHPFANLTSKTKETLENQYQVQLTPVKQALQEKPRSILLLDLPLAIQAEAALGLTNSPESSLLQQAFLTGSKVQVLTDYLVPLNEIVSFEYRKLFISYQRRLKEFGLMFVSQKTLEAKHQPRSVLVEKDIELLAPGSTLNLATDSLLSYGAKEKIKEKGIILNKKR